MYMRTNDYRAAVNHNSFSADDYLYGFGYVGAITVDKSGHGGLNTSIQETPGAPKYYINIPTFSPCSTGGFAIRPRIPVA